ncbi:MAG: ATP-binding protein [Clostridia bacterium]|nr:ATP-binding protein [Clostridia bacterium]
MERLITKEIAHWYSQSRKNALLIDGARQVGKTYIIRDFCKKNCKSFLEINFTTVTPEVHKGFSEISSSEQFISLLTLLYGDKLVPGKTVIFLDEIQECLNLITTAKFLVEDGRFRYILSGSLLGVEMTNVRSLPVGYLDILHMYPMNFMEFCMAYGVGQPVLDDLRNRFWSEIPIDEIVHKRLSELYRLYLVIGGMPAAVQEHLKSHSLYEVARMQQSICEIYKADISKYDRKRKPVLANIFDLIPSELNSQNKRFVYNSISDDRRSKYTEASFFWLADAGIAIPVYCADKPQYPLELSKSRNLLKLFLCDVGLLASMYMDGIQQKIMLGEKDVNFGSVYENAVAQELKSNGLTPYYYNSKKYGELDLVVEMDGVVYPIEIKSGKNYKRHSALNNVLAVDEYRIEKAYVFTNGNVEHSGKKVYMPIYMSMFMQNTPMGEMIYEPNLDGLT